MKQMQSEEIRSRFLKFFSAKGGPASGGEGHKIIPSASLVPENDPSVLFTTAGMQQFKLYYTGEKNAEKDFETKNVVSVQKCIRTSDIDEVGDDTHNTFFEMLGNFSFGGYWKKEAIAYAYEFITKEMGLKIDYVSVYNDDKESETIWNDIDKSLEVRKMGKENNWWGPTGDEGPCGPTTEIYINGIEIWNIVFNQFFQTRDQRLEKLNTQGIDTGMGLERLAMVSQGAANIFETDLFAFLAVEPLHLSKRSDRSTRIIADHVSAIGFLIMDGIIPSNKDQGYVLRRLMRRIIVHKDIDFREIFSKLVNAYPELNEVRILEEFDKEKNKFSKTLDAGLRELKKIETLDAQKAFRLYESFGLPFEVMKDIAPGLNRTAFDEEFKK